MRRTSLLSVVVVCPHFQRPVRAQRNEVNERLVDCDSKGECVTRSEDERGVVVTVYPQGCPVFRT
jgi:hypothetical protein